MNKVPKRIFFYWGNEEMSWLRYMTLKSCRYYNLDWEIVLYYSNSSVNKKTWTDSNQQDFFTYKGINYFEKVHDLGIQVKEWQEPSTLLKNVSPSHKSNFFKWYLLATEGGFYADMDILFIKSLDSLYEKVKDTEVGLCIHDWLSIGFLHSVKDCKFFMDVYNTAMKTYNPSKYQCVGVRAVHALLFGIGKVKKQKIQNIENKFRKRYPEVDLYNYNMDLFYAYTYRELNNLFINEVQMPETSIGIHWYAGNPLSQKWNNELTEKNFSSYKNTITKYAKECC